MIICATRHVGVKRVAPKSDNDVHDIDGGDASDDGYASCYGVATSDNYDGYNMLGGKDLMTMLLVLMLGVIVMSLLSMLMMSHININDIGFYRNVGGGGDDDCEGDNGNDCDCSGDNYGSTIVGWTLSPN